MRASADCATPADRTERKVVWMHAHTHARAHTLPNTHIDRRVVWRLSGCKQAVNTSSMCARMYARVCVCPCVCAACAFVLSPSITLRLPDVSDHGTRARPRADNKPIIR